jgi:hypothetical protein
MRITKLVPATCAIAAILTAAPVRAADRDFHEIVNRLATAYHKKPMPFMGFVSLVARFEQPQGVSGIKFAIFDDIDPSLSPNESEVDNFMQSILGSEFQPFVRVRSHRDHEQTYIYLHNVKDSSEMLVVTIDSSDAVVVKMRLKPEAMKGWMDDPVGEGKHSARNGGLSSRD